MYQILRRGLNFFSKLLNLHRFEPSNPSVSRESKRFYFITKARELGLFDVWFLYRLGRADNEEMAEWIEEEKIALRGVNRTKSSGKILSPVGWPALPP